MAKPAYETMHISWHWDLQGHPITKAADEMNALSRDGWELVSISTTPNVYYESGHATGYFPPRTVGIWHLASFQRPIADRV